MCKFCKNEIEIVEHFVNFFPNYENERNKMCSKFQEIGIDFD